MLPTSINSLLPGVLFVAILAFPAFCFIRKGFFLRLLVACGVPVTFVLWLSFGMGHQFTFLSIEAIPVLVIGLGLAWFISVFCRVALKTWQSRRARTGDR
jgi:hypothetical protein